MFFVLLPTYDWKLNDVVFNWALIKINIQGGS